jgi:hypothetical protein
MAIVDRPARSRPTCGFDAFDSAAFAAAGECHLDLVTLVLSA